MTITGREIERVFRAEFPAKYRRFAGFIDSGELWDRFNATIHDDQLMRNIKFCNDVMLIPPVKVFIMAQKTTLHDLENTEKQTIGAAFGFVFKDIFGYTSQEKVSCVVNTVKSASRFSSPGEEVIIEGEE